MPESQHGATRRTDRPRPDDQAGTGDPRPGDQVGAGYPRPDDQTGADDLRTRVRACIDTSGLVQREFARRIELDETKLSKSLRGTRRFTSAELFRIATVGGVTVNWLMTGSDSSPGPVAVPAPPPASLPRGIHDAPDQGRRRQEIVEAGWRLFAARGLHTVKMSEIAAECHVSTAAVYYYFPSKRDLFEETLRYSVKLAFDRQVASLHLIEGEEARLKHLIDLQLPDDGVSRTEWSIWLQSWSEVAVGAASRQNHSDAYRRWYRTVLDVLREGQESGVFVGDPADALAAQLTSLMDGFGIKVLVGTIGVEQMRGHLHDFIDRVIVAGTQRPSREASGPAAGTGPSAGPSNKEQQ